VKDIVHATLLQLGNDWHDLDEDVRDDTIAALLILLPGADPDDIILFAESHSDAVSLDNCYLDPEAVLDPDEMPRYPEAARDIAIQKMEDRVHRSWQRLQAHLPGSHLWLVAA